MDITIKKKDTGDLYLTPLLQQTAFWSGVKSDLGYIPRAFDDEAQDQKQHRSCGNTRSEGPCRLCR